VMMPKEVSTPAFTGNPIARPSAHARALVHSRTQ